MGDRATWIERPQLERLGAAVGEGRATDIDRLLAEILERGSRDGATPAACAVCRRDLIWSELGRPGLVARTCPEGHGAWMSPDVIGALRRLVHDHATSVRTGRRTAVLSAALAVSLVALAASGLLLNGSIVPRWLRSRSIPDDERRYLRQLVAILDDGAANRRNVEGVLRAGDSAPDTYGAVYEIYRRRAEGVVERLRAAHGRIVRAAERQVVFYGDFTTARVNGKATDLARMFGHPAARETSYELHTAWDLIRGVYPDLSTRELKPIEDRLCHFDAQ